MKTLTNTLRYILFTILGFGFVLILFYVLFYFLQLILDQILPFAEKIGVFGFITLMFVIGFAVTKWLIQLLTFPTRLIMKPLSLISPSIRYATLLYILTSIVFGLYCIYFIWTSWFEITALSIVISIVLTLVVWALGGTIILVDISLRKEREFQRELKIRMKEKYGKLFSN